MNPNTEYATLKSYTRNFQTCGSSIHEFVWTWPHGKGTAVINFKLLQYLTLGALHRGEEIGDIIKISFNRILILNNFPIKLKDLSQTNAFSLSSIIYRSINVHTTVLMRFRLSTLRRLKAICCDVSCTLCAFYTRLRYFITYIVHSTFSFSF